MQRMRFISNYLGHEHFEYILVDNHGLEDWEQMILMSLCDHHIIANSTFSWWGAYFNSNPNKIVYCPSVWFGPGYQDKNTVDLYPTTWKIVEADLIPLEQPPEEQEENKEESDEQETKKEE
jgi:hypothetical protein